MFICSLNFYLFDNLLCVAGADLSNKCPQQCVVRGGVGEGRSGSQSTPISADPRAEIFFPLIMGRIFCFAQTLAISLG